MNNNREALTLEKIGARIRIKRESLGMTQQELSDIVGVSRNTIVRDHLFCHFLGTVFCQAE